MWVYAHLQTTDTEYFVVSGFTGECAGTKTRCEPDIVGTGVALRGKMCGLSAVDSFYFNVDSGLWKLSELAMDDFAKDAIQRYLLAFGGKQSFLKMVSRGQDEKY